MSNYNWFASSFIFPLFGINFFYLGTKYIEMKGGIRELNKMPQIPLIFMGIMDGLNSLLASFSTPYLSIILMTILDKFSLPLILLGSIFILKRRYKKSLFRRIFNKLCNNDIIFTIIY